MNGGLIATALVLGVAVFAWLLRRGAAENAGVAPAAAGLPVDPETLEIDEGSEELALSSEGDVFIPDGHNVRIMPLGDPEEIEGHRDDIEAGLLALSREERLQLRALRGKPGQALQAGDLTAARIKRGAAGVVPWRLETLGRDGEYGFFPFETEDGARAAFRLLETYGVVRRPLDDDGRPIPPSPEDFEEARRRYEESFRALALETDSGEDAGPGAYSDRR